MERNLNVVTHGGVYHADELCALNLYKLFVGVPCLNVVRAATDSQIPDGYLAIDIGLGPLDHHQKEGVPSYDDGTKFCAANRVVQNFGWEYFRSQGLSAELCDWAIGQLQMELKPIAEQDNYGPAKHGNTFSCFCSSLNGTLDFEGALAAVEPFMKALLNKHVKRALLLQEHPEVLSLSGEVADVGYYLPPDLFPAQVRFIVCESLRGGFNVTSQDSERWPVKATKGENGCTFVHASRFLAAFESHEQALDCAWNSLS